jgi:hypothetical protein
MIPSKWRMGIDTDSMDLSWATPAWKLQSQGDHLVARMPRGLRAGLCLGVVGRKHHPAHWTKMATEIRDMWLGKWPWNDCRPHNLVLVEGILIVQGFSDSIACPFEVRDHTLHEQQSLSMAKLLAIVGANMYKHEFYPWISLVKNQLVSKQSYSLKLVDKVNCQGSLMHLVPMCLTL